MIYSVWEPSRQRYKYYQDTQGVSDEPPIPSKKGRALGAAPGEISWRVPKDAKYTGVGVKAQGVVVHPDNLGDFDLGNSVSIVLMLSAGYLLWKFLEKDE